MKKGFTLMELLIYVALFSLIVSLVFRFSLSLIDTTVRANAKEEVQVNAASLLKLFDFEVRGATEVYDSTSDFTGNPGQLSLVTTRGLPPYATETYIDIYLDDGRLCTKHELTGVTCHTSEKVEVTSLEFEKITQSGGAESVQIKATLQFRSQRTEYQNEEIIQTSVRLQSY